MKKLFCIAFITCVFSLFAFSHGYTLAEHSKIRELSSFRVMGEIDLRTKKDMLAPVEYRTLNHEGGMKVKVLEIVGAGSQDGKGGLWLYVLLTAPMWVESGEWIEKYQKFLIFLPDDVPVFDFEE